MRFSQLLGRTLRDAPADADLASHQLVMRAALARPLASGLWTYLPLGWRAVEKLAALIRQTMSALGFQELHMPTLHPAEVWQATGRWETFGPALQRVRNHDGHAFALAPAYEEVAADLARREIDSHRQLPWRFFQMQPHYRDESRPRGGLILPRETTAHDATSLHADESDLDHFFQEAVTAYQQLLAECDLPVRRVTSTAGPFSQGEAIDFMLPHQAGEERFVTCESCDYAANTLSAEFIPSPGASGEPAAMEKVATPSADTIAGLADFLGISTHQTLKAVFYTRKHDNALIFALLRGDLDIDEQRLSHAIGGGDLRPATDDEIAEAGASPGYASPVGLSVRSSLDDPTGVRVIADPSIERGVNFASGANEDGYHCVNVNYPRDFAVTLVATIAAVPEDATCAECGGPLHVERAIQLGSCRKPGAAFTDAVGASYLDEDGQAQPIFMGSYGLNLDRLLAAILETHHDEHGIVWPSNIAPLPVHLLTLGKGDEVRQTADHLYADLAEAGIEALYDDRPDESAGVKFNDADLIGLPLRITVGERGLKEGNVEVKWRAAEDRETVPLTEAASAIITRLESGPPGTTSS